MCLVAREYLSCSSPSHCLTTRRRRHTAPACTRVRHEDTSRGSFFVCYGRGGMCRKVPGLALRPEGHAGPDHTRPRRASVLAPSLTGEHLIPSSQPAPVDGYASVLTPGWSRRPAEAEASEALSKTRPIANARPAPVNRYASVLVSLSGTRAIGHAYTRSSHPAGFGAFEPAGLASHHTPRLVFRAERSTGMTHAAAEAARALCHCAWRRGRRPGGFSCVLGVVGEVLENL
ncbi:hypothetical protein C8Q80DRAFT_461781 [Daedaleopsis nitida]|nr:hypothetical protein C8Q80DRAFT_461781 [Daedaleopsis nitida]